jgi:hypothetical protein
MHVDGDPCLYHRAERNLPPCGDTISGYTGPSQRSVSRVLVEARV